MRLPSDVSRPAASQRLRRESEFGPGPSGQLEELLRVFVKQLALDSLVRREAADGGDGLRALTFLARAVEVVAIAAVEQFVLVALEESGRECSSRVSALRPEPAERSPNMFG